MHMVKANEIVSVWHMLFLPLPCIAFILKSGDSLSTILLGKCFNSNCWGVLE